MIEFKHRPDVDGLRAIAVTMVLLFHAGLGFSGGYVGVDIFFVISGFLITGLILKEQKAGTFTLANFWVRRIRRIIPAATVMVVVVLLAGFFLLVPSDYVELANSAIAQQFMLSNVYFWKNTGYFDGPADLKPLLHTWSLAVEEQFYLGYPFLLVFLNRFRRPTVGVVLAGLAIVSLAVSQYRVVDHPSSTFFLLPTRAWELLLGGLVCFLPAPTRIKPWLAGLLSGLSLGGMLAASWLFTSTTTFPGINALLPCGAAALLIYANAHRLSFPASLLAAKPVVFVGLISYSLYLWHWPTLALVRYWSGSELPPLVGAMALAISFCLAYLSWRFVETPFRRAPATKSYKTRTVWAYAASACVCLFLSIVVLQSEGARFRLPPAALKFDHKVQGAVLKEFDGDLSAVQDGRLPEVGATAKQPAERSVDFVLWGDSHARMLAKVCDELAAERQLRGIVASKSSTGPFLNCGSDDQLQWNRAVLDLIVAQGVRTAILAGRWENHFNEALVEKHRLSLDQTVQTLRHHGVDVWIIEQVPTQEWDPNPRLLRAAYFGHKLPTGVSLAAYQVRHRHSHLVFDDLKRQGVEVIDVEAACFDSTRQSILGDTGGSFYWDDDHLSPYGAERLLAPLLAPIFDQTAQSKALAVGAPAQRNRNSYVSLEE